MVSKYFSITLSVFSSQILTSDTSIKLFSSDYLLFNQSYGGKLPINMCHKMFLLLR